MSAQAVQAVSLAFKKALIERALGAELSHHLGYTPGSAKPEEATNHRNGVSAKTVLTEDGPVPIEVPRDREGSFEPLLIPKHERRFTGCARVIALDTSDERLARAKEMGADVLVNPKTAGNVVQAIRDLTHGSGAHLSLDASSSPDARAQAVRCVRTWGKACFVGEGDTVTLDVSNDMLRRQVTIIWSWTFSTIGQAECARYVADRKVDVDSLFTHRWRLDYAEEAYRLFDAQTAGKGVILPS